MLIGWLLGRGLERLGPTRQRCRRLGFERLACARRAGRVIARWFRRHVGQLGSGVLFDVLRRVSLGERPDGTRLHDAIDRHSKQAGDPMRRVQRPRSELGLPGVSTRTAVPHFQRRRVEPQAERRGPRSCRRLDNGWVSVTGNSAVAEGVELSPAPLDEARRRDCAGTRYSSPSLPRPHRARAALVCSSKVGLRRGPVLAVFVEIASSA